MAFDPQRPTVVKFPDLPKLPPVSSGGVRTALIVIVALLLAFTCVYTIDPEEVGVVTRFGKFTGIADPGLNFKIPFGVDRVQKIPVQRQLKQEFGFRTIRSDVESNKDRRGYGRESSMLTGDLNAVQVQWVVQYRIDDPYMFLFRVRHVENTFRDMSEAVMRSVVGDRTVNEVLTVGRQEVELLVKEQLQGLSDQYETGIAVDQVVLQTINPPDQVKDSFDRVNQAEQEKARLVNEAQSEYNKVIPRAEGEALQAIQQAEGYAVNRTNRAAGDAARFEALFGEYQKAPEVTRTRIYLETLSRVLPNTGRKVVVDDDLEGVLPLLNLGGASTPPPAGGGE